MIIDLHSHLIPNIDDGAQTIEQSVELAKLAVSEGVGHMVLTPHHRYEKYFNRKQDIVTEFLKLEKTNADFGVQLKDCASQELRINESFFDDLYNDDLFPLDASGHHYFIEFPTATIPDYAFTLVKEMINQGIRPVITHPERNHVFVKDMKTS